MHCPAEEVGHWAEINERILRDSGHCTGVGRVEWTSLAVSTRVSWPFQEGIGNWIEGRDRDGVFILCGFVQLDSMLA